MEESNQWAQPFGPALRSSTYVQNKIIKASTQIGNKGAYWLARGQYNQLEKIKLSNLSHLT